MRVRPLASVRQISVVSGMTLLTVGSALACKTTGANSGSYHTASDAIQTSEYFNRVPSLGDGIDTDLFRWAPNGNCFSAHGTAAPVPHTDNSVHYIATHVDSVQTAGSELGFSSNLELSYGLIKGDANAKYASSATSSDLTSTWIFTEEVVTQSIAQPGTTLGVTSTGWTFRNQCGNRYVSQITTGARVSAIIKFQFNDTTSMKTFQQNFNLSVPAGQWGATVSEAVNTQFKNANSASSVSIELIKSGGPDPSTSLQGSPVINCKASDTASCTAVLTDLANYVGNFSSGVTTANSSVIAFVTSAYPITDAVANTPALTAANQAALTDLGTEYLKELTDSSRASDLLANPNLQEKRPLLQAIVTTVASNQTLLGAAIQACLDSNGQTCYPHTAHSVGLQAYNSSVLTLFNTVGDGKGYNNSNYVGGAGGSAPTDPTVSQCYNYLSGFYSRGGSAIDQLGIACYAARGNDWRSMVGLATNASQQPPISCVQGSAVTAIGVKMGSLPGYPSIVQGLGVTCTRINDIQSGTATPITYSSGVINWAPGDENNANWSSCSPGSYAVGVNFKAGNHIDGLSLQCVPITLSTVDPTAPVSDDPTAPTSGN